MTWALVTLPNAPKMVSNSALLQLYGRFPTYKRLPIRTSPAIKPNGPDLALGRTKKEMGRRNGPVGRSGDRSEPCAVLRERKRPSSDPGQRTNRWKYIHT